MSKKKIVKQNNSEQAVVTEPEDKLHGAKYVNTEGRSLKVESTPESMFQTTGTHDRDLWLKSLLCCQKATPRSGEEESDKALTNASFAMMRGINPKDELEGMLALQMVATHNMAMEMAERCLIKGQTVDGVDRNVNRMTKLTRSFTTQMEALNRYRGKGQQKMTVEHVHVNEGGQAIIGDVNNTEGGGKS